MKNSPARKPSCSAEPGGIYRLGEHFLACGDATDEDLVAKILGGTKVDLVLTDPPYGVAYTEGKRGFAKLASGDKPIANDHEQTDEEYAVFTGAWMSAVAPHLAAKNACYVFNSDKMIFALRNGMVAAGWKLAQVLVWVKDRAVIGRMDHLPQHEYVAYGWRGTHAFRKSKDKSVLLYPKPSRSPDHPTQKPVPLLRRLVLNVTKRGGVVYDPFGGSGSTLLACEQTRRRCVTIELDPGYCATIIRRWESLTGGKAITLK